eukprot:jgi/Hompol1/5241/HPOL_004274-RA
MSSTTAATAKLSREDFRKQKIIEEQRKAGTLPAEVDPETGRDINPHIPQYIAKAPWYLDINHATLKHQRFVEPKSTTEWYARGVRAGPAATKYRKGACENCGAMTHKSADCFDRPRRKGAKWTGEGIQADEVVLDVELGFEAKRDRWNGYDASEHLKIVEDWELVEEKRRLQREKDAKEKIEAAAAAAAAAKAAATAASATGESSSASGTGSAGGSSAKVATKSEAAIVAAAAAATVVDDSSDDEDEDKYAEQADVVGQKVDSKSRVTVRNLRIREDTAKYLLNLDVNSAYYDPKTRSMRGNPHAGKDPSEVIFAGDNVWRYSGDVSKVAQLQQFAWQAENRGKEVHMQANPTQTELLYKEFMAKKGEVSQLQKQSILSKYGGAEHLDAPPKELLLAQTENYVEYSQTGKLIKGQEKASLKSKYEEDIYPLNHTSVWGSWWEAGKWGYACCHATLRAAYCGGQAAIEAAKAAHQHLTANSNNNSSSHADNTSPPKKSLLDQYVQRAAKTGTVTSKSTESSLPSRKRLGEGDVTIDSDKLKEAIDAERKRKLAARDEGDNDGRFSRIKQKYNSNRETTELTEEQLEAYRLEQQRGEDPMANYVDSDE